MASREEIIAQLTFEPDIQRDVDGLVCRILRVRKRTPLVDRTKQAIAADNAVIDYIFKHGGGSTNWRVDDALKKFKEIQRNLAKAIYYSYAESSKLSSEYCWNKMQDRFAGEIADTYGLKALMA